jgi:type III secretion system FlhB-like substrate exporter
LESFAKDKTIPENIYDIVAENHALKEQLKEMRKEK